MAQKTTLKIEVAEQAIAKFPQAATMTLAKKIYKENKGLYLNVEDARDKLRYIKGSKGSRSRANREKATGEPTTGNTFVIPEPDNTEWLPFTIPVGDYNMLILSDIHFPYHDKEALEIALNYGLKNNCTSLLINGDMLDFYQLSRFDKDPRKRHFQEEIEMGRDFLLQCSKHFKHVYFKLGNHCERYEKYLYVKAPEFLNVPDFQFKVLLKAAEMGVHVIEDKRIIDLGYLNILHGHEFLGATSQAVNPARGLFLKTNESCVIGHLHKSSEHNQVTLNGKLITTWSTGCLCDLHPEYARINNWNHGFALVEVKSDGSYRLHNKRIYNKKVL